MYIIIIESKEVKSKTNKQTNQELHTMSKEQVVKVETETLESLMSQYKTKSALIRELHSRGKTRGEIAKFMGIRYQHVRNVLITPIKKV